MASPYMVYQDLAQAVIQYAGANPTTQAVQQARRAASVAYLNIVAEHNWTFYKRMFSVPTTPVQIDGTIEYLQTTGAVPRQLTITGNIWPSWSVYGYLVLNQSVYQVTKLVSPTVLQLDVNNNPGSDIVAGTPYQLFRDTYPLPNDFTKAFSAVTQPGGIVLKWVPIATWAYGRDYLLAAGRPIQFTITGDVNVPQRQAVRFWPASDTTYSVLFTYEANIIPPKYLQVSDGLASTTAGSATVTGSGTNWETAMAGTVIRFSRNATTYPTGTEGENPAFAEYIVDSVQSPTSLTLQENATDTQTSVKSSISSLLDIDWYTHRDYLFKEAYRQYRNMARVAAVSGEMMDWQRALTSARQLDSKYEGWQGSSPWRPVLSFYDVSPINLQ